MATQNLRTEDLWSVPGVFVPPNATVPVQVGLISWGEGGVMAMVHMALVRNFKSCTYSNATLAEMLGVSKRTVGNYVKRLVVLGLLQATYTSTQNNVTTRHLVWGWGADLPAEKLVKRCQQELKKQRAATDPIAKTATGEGIANFARGGIAKFATQPLKREREKTNTGADPAGPPRAVAGMGLVKPEKPTTPPPAWAADLAGLLEQALVRNHQTLFATKQAAANFAKRNTKTWAATIASICDKHDATGEEVCRLVHWLVSDAGIVGQYTPRVRCASHLVQKWPALLEARERQLIDPAAWPPELPAKMDARIYSLAMSALTNWPQATKSLAVRACYWDYIQTRSAVNKGLPLLRQVFGICEKVPLTKEQNLRMNRVSQVQQTRQRLWDSGQLVAKHWADLADWLPHQPKWKPENLKNHTALVTMRKTCYKECTEEAVAAHEYAVDKLTSHEGYDRGPDYYFAKAAVCK